MSVNMLQSKPSNAGHLYYQVLLPTLFKVGQSFFEELG
jgi:hypothetical protein